jgi:single stranded DNA-binding protein
MARRTSTSTAVPAPQTVEAAPERQDVKAQEAEQVTLVGRLCADPVLRHTKSGIAVTTIRIAVNTPGEDASFHSVVVWKRNAEVVCQYLGKGRMVEVTGRPQTRSWTDSDGNEREAVEISAYRVQFLSRQAVSATSEKEVA